MPRLKRKFLILKNKIFVAFLAVIVLLVFLFTVKFTLPILGFARSNNLSPFFLVSLIFQKYPQVKLNNSRFNLVILGISGGNHDGSNLTDSINFVSIDFSQKDALIVSVPRDIYLPSLKTKINSTYYYGEKKKPGGGLILAKSSVSEVLGQPVDYAFVLDFSTFKEIVNALGGIDVDVDRGFTDNLYPIPGKEDDLCNGDPEYLCRYETVTFQEGLQHMNGETALKFVRSRYSHDGEGTDFSRSKRQHEVMVALISKIKSIANFKNIDLLKRLFNLTYKSLRTDMNLAEMISLAKYFAANRDITIRQAVLDSGNDVQDIPGLLINPPAWQYDGLWVLVPRTGDYQEIYDYINCEIENRNCPIKPMRIE